MKLNIEKGIEEGLRLLNTADCTRYDITIYELNQIVELSEYNTILAAANAFELGFYQGFKAAKKLHTHTHTQGLK